MTTDDKINHTYTDILETALEAPHGIAMEVGSMSDAQKLRRRLYWERNKARQAGDDQYEGLSMVVQAPGELIVVQRPAIPKTAMAPVLEIRELRPGEAPRDIRSRGPRRPGILEQYIADQCIAGSLNPVNN